MTDEKPTIRTKKSLAERETIIRRSADEDAWDIFTEDARVARLLERLGVRLRQNGDGVRGLLGYPFSISFRRARVLTGEQKAALAARAKTSFGRKP